MVVGEARIHNIMGGMENTAGVRLHNHRRKLKQRFDIIRKLGQGTYGKVQLGINKETGQEVAIKTIKKAKIETEADLVRIRREIQIMSSVQHPNIIHIYEVFENREKMVLVMEYAAGGELYDYLSERKVLTEQEARRIFRQIATAVYYCHKHKICHRDLKLENILLDEHGSAKIADFGLSNVFDEQRLLNTFCGSPLYASPEIVKGTPYHGPEVDCWSLGVLLYTLVYGAMPFDGSNFKRLVKQISQGDYFEPKKPSPASPLIRDMLTVPPTRRADIEKICSHWWVNEDYTESCLEIAEELANQTPVRLDLLLSLAPPAPSVGSDKLLITKEQATNDGVGMAAAMVPARCHSVGSLMELDHSSVDQNRTGFEKERRQQAEIGNTDAHKRKLEEGISTDEANQAGSKRKERSRRHERERSSDRRHHRSSSRNKQTHESNNKSPVEVKDENVKNEQAEDMDIDSETSSFALQYVEPFLRESEETITGSVKAAASSVETIAGSSSAVIEQEQSDSAPKSPVKEKAPRKSVKKKSKSTDDSEVANKISGEAIDGDLKDEQSGKVRKKKLVASEPKSKDLGDIPGDKTILAVANHKDSDLVDLSDQTVQKLNTNSCDSETKGNIESAASSPKINSSDNQERIASKPIEMPKKGIKARKSKGELSLGKLGSSSEKSSGTNTPEDTASPPSRPMERRRSKIFETAEKFNNLLSGSSEPRSPTSDKPKKVFIPGVKVSDAKRAFERKSSLPEAIVPTLSKTSIAKKAVESNSDTTGKTLLQDNGDVSAAQKIEKQLIESNQLDVKEKDLNEGKSNRNQETMAPDKGIDVTNVLSDSGEAEQKPEEEDANLQLIPALPVTDRIAQQEEARIKKLKDAVEIISNAIAEESRKDVIPDSSKKVSSSKPPVPASADNKGRPKVVGVSSPTSPKSPPPSPLDPGTGKKTVRVQVAPNDIRLATIQVSTPEVTKFPFNENDLSKTENVQATDDVSGPIEDARNEKLSNKDSKSVEDSAGKKKSAKVEITLKSATLPRRKTSKAEIHLGSPPVPPVEFKTEVEHMVGGSLLNKTPTQRSEVAFPVAAVSSTPSAFRSISSEPEDAPRTKPREHIIPIKLEDNSGDIPPVSSPPPSRPPVPPLQQQRSLSQSQRSGSLSRQSTQDSDTEGPDTIHKSPREFIIPIAMEGGGYVTPRAGSLEPSASDESTAKLKQRSSSRFGRPRRMSSLLSDASEDEGFNSPFATLQRHSSLGRDDDDDRSFHMHRLRSSRPSRHPLEHADSLSSAEEDDDDDGFEILTAESLFSTLLSRVRSLTQRLNVEDATRPGFPSSRLMNQLKTIGHTSPSMFWNNVYGHQHEPLSRRLSESSQFSRSFSRDSELGSTPWRRSVSRDVSDCDSVYSETSSTAGTLPRGSARQEDCGACDEAASEASSTTSSFPCHYTPSLARRISQHYKRRSTDEELGAPGNINVDAAQPHDDHPSRRDYLTSVGNSLSYLQSHDNAHYIPTSSRRLARTLSMRSAEERSRSGSRRREYLPVRRLSYLESRDARNTGDLYNKSSYRGSSHSDIDEYKKRDYLPPTCRSLRMYDTSSSVLGHRGSSASDTGDYYSRKPWETSSVLPPLPHNTLSYSRRKDSLPSRSYARQRSADIIDNSYVPHQNRIVPSKILETTGENFHDRPRHSSSLPSMVGGKSLRSKSISAGVHSVSSHSQSKPDMHHRGNENICIADDTDYTDKREKESLINSLPSDNSDVQDKDLPVMRERQKDSEKKNRSQIPSLLRFRSSSLCRETNTSKPRNTGSEEDQTSSRSTPDRSILSKFFRQGSEERGKSDNSTENKENSDAKKKTRRISRFLRPDFFDTPREESTFVKEKEAQKAAEEEKKKAKRVARRAALLEKKEKEAQKVSNDKEGQENGAIIEPGVLDKCDQNQSKESCIHTAENCIESNVDTKLNNGVTVTNLNETNNGTSNKNRFLHSLEKKWEKFKSTNDDTSSVTPCGKSRVEKAIRSLRERSVTPRGSDIMTSESNLLKRAVSVDDMCTKANLPATKGINCNSSKVGSKVSSVLGLFRKMEDSPSDAQKLPQSVNRPSLLLSRLRRTQSVYAGSQSDSVLHAHSQEILDSSASEITSSENQSKSNLNELSENNTANNANTNTNHPAENVPISSPKEDSTTTNTSITISTVLQEKDKNQKTNGCMPASSSEAPSGKTSNKMPSKKKVVKELSSQKDGMAMEKLKSVTTGALEVQKGIPSKLATTRKTNLKKTAESSVINKTATNNSGTQNSKICRTSVSNKGPTKNEISSTSKSSCKKLNTGNIPVNADKKTLETQCSDTLSEDISVLSEFQIKSPVSEEPVASEINEIYQEDTNIACNIKSVSSIDGAPSFSQKNEINSETAVGFCEEIKPELLVETDLDCKNVPVASLLNVTPSCKNVEEHAGGKDCLGAGIAVCENDMNGSVLQGATDGTVNIAAVGNLDSNYKPYELITTPVDECESLDSCSLCSDFDSQDLSVSPLPSLDEEGTESVQDRIRRKSFYSRFNDIKKKNHRKLSPSYVTAPNFGNLQHYKTQGNLSLSNQPDLMYPIAPCSRKSPLPSRTQHPLNNLSSACGENQNYELHNGFDKGSVIENTKSSQDEQTLFRALSPSNSSEKSSLYSNLDTRRKGTSSHLLRPADFTQDVIRKSSLTKSRLPTASRDRRAITPVGSRLAILNSRSPKSGNQANAATPEGENLPLDGKCDRFNSESSPSS